MTALEVRSFLIAVLVKKGMYAVEAEIVADRLLDADSLGHCDEGSRSLSRYVKSINMGDIDPRAVMLQKSETPAIAYANANEGMGQLAATRGMETAIAKAKEVGLGLMVISNSQNLGSPLIYARLAAQQGLIGACLTCSAEEVEAIEVKTEPASACEAFLQRQLAAYAIPSEGGFIGVEFCSQKSPEAISALPQMFGFGLLHSVLTSGLTGGRIPSNKTRGPHLERTEHFLLALNPEVFAGSQALDKKMFELEQHFSQQGIELKKHPLQVDPPQLDEQTLNELQRLGEEVHIPWPGQNS